MDRETFSVRSFDRTKLATAQIRKAQQEINITFSHSKELIYIDNFAKEKH